MAGKSFIAKKTVTETFLERVRVSANSVAFMYKPTHPELGEPNAWRKVTFREFFNDVRAVSFGLMSLGLKAGEKAVILSSTRYEWSLFDMAILGASAVTVPIYPSNTADDVRYVIEHSEASILVVEDGTQLEKLVHIRKADPKALSRVQRVIVIDPAGMTVAARNAEQSPDIFKMTLTLPALRELGRREDARAPGRFEANLRSAKPTDLLTICYTSGTTGIPKGVMITHDNMASVLEDAGALFGQFVEPKGEIILSFLPFSHILGKVESMLIYTFGWTEAFAENIDKLMTNLGEVRPTLIFAVPRIFEKAYGRIHAMLAEGSTAKRKLFERALASGLRYNKALREQRFPALTDALEYTAASQLIFGKIRDRFGGRLKYAVCGGAPLPAEIGEFFQAVGVKILEGYGLTETTAPVSFNAPQAMRYGSVGKPLADVTFKIAEDGEILVKSRKVFAGYYKDDEATAKVMEDGWFHTGDIGHIDDQGYLHITDRKKDLIITSGGKNIAPQKLENLAKTLPPINQFVVFGDRRNYLTALITLDRDQVIKYASENDVLFSEYAELIHHPKVLSLVQQAIDQLNQGLASFETIKKFMILPNDFTIEAGEMTPSMKIRRNVIAKKYKAEIDKLYS